MVCAASAAGDLRPSPRAVLAIGHLIASLRQVARKSYWPPILAMCAVEPCFISIIDNVGGSDFPRAVKREVFQLMKRKGIVNIASLKSASATVLGDTVRPHPRVSAAGVQRPSVNKACSSECRKLALLVHQRFAIRGPRPPDAPPPQHILQQSAASGPPARRQARPRPSAAPGCRC